MQENHAAVPPRRTFGRRSVRVVGLIALMAGLATASTGCTPSDASLGCDAGRLVVTPGTSHPGETVTVRTELGGCRARYPLFLSGPETATTSSPRGVWKNVGKVRPRGDGSFTQDVTLPGSLGPGRYLFMVQAPYPRCPVNASCAILEGAVDVTLPVGEASGTHSAMTIR